MSSRTDVCSGRTTTYGLRTPTPALEQQEHAWQSCSSWRQVGRSRHPCTHTATHTHCEHLVAPTTTMHTPGVQTRVQTPPLTLLRRCCLSVCAAQTRVSHLSGFCVGAIVAFILNMIMPEEEAHAPPTDATAAAAAGAGSADLEDQMVGGARGLVWTHWWGCSSWQRWCQ